MSDNSKISSKNIKPGKKKVTIQSDKQFGTFMQDPKDSTNNTEQHNMSSFQQYPEVSSYQQSKGLDAFQYRIGNDTFEASTANENRQSLSEAQGLDEWKRELKLETGKKSNSMKILRMNHLNSLKYDYKFPDIDSDIVDSIVRYPEPLNPATQTILKTQSSFPMLPLEVDYPQNKQMSMENLSTPRKTIPSNKLKRGDSLLVQLQQPSFNSNAPPKTLNLNQPQVQSNQFDENYFLPLNSNLKKIDYNQTFESLQRAVNKDIVNDLLVRRIRRAYTREESSVGASPQNNKYQTERKITLKQDGNISDGYGDMNQFQGKKQESENNDADGKSLLKQKMKTTSGWWNRKININGSNTPTGQQIDENNNNNIKQERIRSSIRLNNQQQKGAAGYSFTSLSQQKYVDQQDTYSQEQLKIQQAKQRRVDEAFKNEISRFSLRTLGSFKHLLHSFKKSSNIVDYQDIHRQLIQQISVPAGIQFSSESHGNQPYSELDRVSNDQSYFFRQTEKSLREHSNALKSETEQHEVKHSVLRLKRHEITDKLYGIAQEIREILKQSYRYEKQQIRHSSTRAILSQNRGKFVKVITKKPPEDELKSMPTQEQEENLRQLKETKEELERSLSAVDRELEEGEGQLKRIKEKKEVTRQMMKELYTESLKDATLSSKQNLIDTVRALLEIDEDITKQKELLPSFLDKESQKYILKVAGLENLLDHLEASLKSNESENDPARTQANKAYDQSYFRMQKKFKLQDVKAKVIVGGD